MCIYVMLKMFGRVRGGVYALKIVKKADLSRFKSEVSRATPSKFILIYDTKLFVDY